MVNMFYLFEFSRYSVQSYCFFLNYANYFYFFLRIWIFFCTFAPDFNLRYCARVRTDIWNNRNSPAELGCSAGRGFYSKNREHRAQNTDRITKSKDGFG